ncbi:MAG: 16S rRNA (cytidine(1402)-2'-O)-methyltransferase [Alicyclobacillus sp.]|nr:16S rRNA (cytidine(1402)-2'-O)-methyltransferase [Alicyclobacillus sp.]
MTREVYSFEETGAKLFVCSTPIGNLSDVSERLLETLRSVDIVAAEDTRQTRKLLSRYDIHPPELWSYHEHNAASRAEALLSAWRDGKQVALVSDAGTPLVSDPGATAVDLAIAHRVPVVPVPGPSAVLAALVASGVAPVPFTFLGFLPRNKAALRAALSQAAATGWTFVFYEAPHRLERTFGELCDVVPDRPVCVARELTKRYEAFLRGTAADVLAEIQRTGARGEYVVVVGPGSAEVATSDPGTAADHAELTGQDAQLQAAVAEVRRRMAQGDTHRSAVQAVAEAFGVRRKSLYDETKAGAHSDIE